MKPFPDFSYELPFWNKNTYVIGLDEVGRGCLAGPVHVGGVCYPLLAEKEQKAIQKLKIHDSKLCTQKKREKLAPEIKEKAVCWKTASSSVEEINRLGIVPAIEKAALTIIEELASKLPSSSLFVVFTDTLPIKVLYNRKNIKQHPIAQGDAKSITVASASIIAKVERDNYMDELHNSHPHFGWKSNKGYATKAHRQAIIDHGQSPLHRTLYLRKLFSN